MIHYARCAAFILAVALLIRKFLIYYVTIFWYIFYNEHLIVQISMYIRLQFETELFKLTFVSFLWLLFLVAWISSQNKELQKITYLTVVLKL